MKIKRNAALELHVLSEQEQRRLIVLGREIVMCLACNAHGNRLPCRTDRLEAVRLMQEYIYINEIGILEKF